MRRLAFAGLMACVGVALAGEAYAASIITFAGTTTSSEASNSGLPYIPGGNYLVKFASNIPTFPSGITIYNLYQTQECSYFDGGGLMGCDEQFLQSTQVLPPAGANLSNFHTVIDIPPLPGPVTEYYPDGQLFLQQQSLPEGSAVDMFFQNNGTEVTNFSLTVSLAPEPSEWMLMITGLALAGPHFGRLPPGERLIRFIAVAEALVAISECGLPSPKRSFSFAMQPASTLPDIDT